jgi:hypothetical protein
MVTLTVKNAAGSSPASHLLTVYKFRLVTASTTTTLASVTQR